MKIALIIGVILLFLSKFCTRYTSNCEDGEAVKFTIFTGILYGITHFYIMGLVIALIIMFL